MNVKWIRGWLSLALGILVLLSAGPGVAGEANDQLKQSVDKVLAILNDPTLKGMGNSQERRQQLKEVVYSRFDFNEMAKRVLWVPNGRSAALKSKRSLYKSSPVFSNALTSTTSSPTVVKRYAF